jgi:hypothetical protein
MIFPSGFPDRAQSAVLAEQIRAMARMENELAYLLLNPGPKTELLGKLGRGYLMEILAVFAKEACGLGRAGTWKARQIDLAVTDFMRQLAIDFRSEYSHIGMPPMLDNWGTIDPGVLREIKLSDKWKAYQNDLLEVAELQSAPPTSSAESDATGKSYSRKMLDDLADARSKAMAQFDAERLLEELRTTAGSAPARLTENASIQKKRNRKEPNPEILSGLDAVSRTKAAEALGVTTRTIDRLVTDSKLHPIGDWGHKKFKTKELMEFMNRKKKGQARQKKTK